VASFDRIKHIQCIYQRLSIVCKRTSIIFGTRSAAVAGMKLYIQVMVALNAGDGRVGGDNR
jgi:hypothetical protein